MCGGGGELDVLRKYLGNLDLEQENSWYQLKDHKISFKECPDHFPSQHSIKRVTRQKGVTKFWKPQFIFILLTCIDGKSCEIQY